MILEFKGSEELFQFTMETKKQSEIEMMKEAVNDYDESHVSTQTIFDFINFWSFFNDISIALAENGKTLDVFLSSMEKFTINPNYLDILSNFKMSKINLLGIKDLYLELTHKEEAKRKQIFKIIENSKIRFVKEKKTFEVEVRPISPKDDKNKTQAKMVQIFKLLDITELKHRANLVVYTEQNKTENRNYQEEEVKKFKEFDSFAFCLIKIIESLNKLKISGYPDIINLVL